jgi:hypothetical protein
VYEKRILQDRLVAGDFGVLLDRVHWKTMMIAEKRRNGKQEQVKVSPPRKIVKLVIKERNE